MNTTASECFVVKLDCTRVYCALETQKSTKKKVFGTNFWKNRNATEQNSSQNGFQESVGCYRADQFMEWIPEK